MRHELVMGSTWQEPPIARIAIERVQKLLQPLLRDAMVPHRMLLYRKVRDTWVEAVQREALVCAKLICPNCADERPVIFTGDSRFPAKHEWDAKGQLITDVCPAGPILARYKRRGRVEDKLPASDRKSAAERTLWLGHVKRRP